MQNWTIIIPVKGTPQAKSRFAPGDNQALALAMALDTVEVALTVAPVIVVASHGLPFEELGAQVVRDPGGGLNAAIAAGVAAASGATAILLGDHPALTTAELGEALDRAANYERSLVADADGTGSALTTSRTTHDPHFGPDSRARHTAAGYVELDGDWPGLRRDIDTADQLAGLTLGPRTVALLQAQTHS